MRVLAYGGKMRYNIVVNKRKKKTLKNQQFMQRKFFIDTVSAQTICDGNSRQKSSLVEAVENLWLPGIQKAIKQEKV